MLPKSNLTMRMISLIVLVFFLSGCTVTVPERFATLQEAYPPNESLTPPPDAPPDSYKKGTFAAPFEDVFRAVNVAASQAQLNVESTDKRKGQILATRFAQVQPRGFSGDYSLKTFASTYSYMIAVSEKGPKTTEVLASSKVQITCERVTALGWIGRTLAVPLTFGLMLVVLPFQIRDDNRCADLSTAQWATGELSSQQELDRLLIFTRNNLIAAGAL